MTNGPPNPEQALRAVRAAKEALDAAIQLTEQRQHQLATDIKTAKALLGEVIKAENTLGPTAPPQLTAAGLDKSAAALNASCDLLSTAGLESKVGSSIDEWKECRTTIDRFDKILVDLRKTGFGFITAVVGAAAYLFQGAHDFGAKAGLFVMLVLLIVTLYLVDLAHQTWLGVSVNRAKTLEGMLGFTLTKNISKEFAAGRAVWLGFLLYLFLLIATFGIFWSSVPAAESPLSGHHMTICSAFIIGLVLIIGLAVYVGWSSIVSCVLRISGIKSEA